MDANDYIEALHTVLGDLMGSRSCVDEVTFLKVLSAQKNGGKFSFLGNETSCSGEQLLEAYCFMNNTKYDGVYGRFILDGMHIEFECDGFVEKIFVGDIL